MSLRDSLARWIDGPVRRLAWQAARPAGLVAMFALAFAVRAVIAPRTGFDADLGYFRSWAIRLAEVGPRDFYAPGEFQDYPPGYLYVLWLTGKLAAVPGTFLLKLPPMLADLGLAWVAGTFAARLAPLSLGERWPVRTVVAAAVLFNPAIVGLSAVWGQVDSVPALVMLGSLLLLFTYPAAPRYEIPAFLLLAVTVAIKPQAAFALPIMLYALYRRHLHGRRLAEAVDGVIAICLAAILSLSLWALSGVPFGLGPVSLVRFYADSAATHPYTSSNAFNLWGAIAFWRNDSTGENVLTVAGMPAVRVGTLLFLAALAVVVWRLHRSLGRGASDAVSLTIAAASTSLLAYALLTRMHERYMFLALATFAPLLVVRPLRLAYAGLSALLFLNLWYAYASFNVRAGVEGFHLNPWFDWIFGGWATDPWQKKALSLAVVAVTGIVAWSGPRWAESFTRFQAGGADEWASSRSPTSARTPARPADRGSGEAPAWLASRSGPLAVVTLACLFGLVALHGETTPVPNLNDSAFHLQMVRWADGQLAEGRLPLDGWYPYLSLGSSQFHHYQSLPHTLTALVARGLGMEAQTAYLWILYLLLALWPIAVYWGARLLGWGRWTAAGAAAVAPLLVSASGYGFEHGSYTWQGYGVYSQLWAMWLLPVTWGLTWRAVARGAGYAAAVGALALTIACHFIVGYLALLTLGVWVLAGGPGYLRRLGRGAVVGVGSIVTASWVVVPLVRDSTWITRSEYYEGSIFNDSYGAQQVLDWLFAGRLFDDGRFPVVTILAAAGAVACLRRLRADIRARALLGASALSLALFFGRRTFGVAIDLLPGFENVQIHRFVVGVHLAGILLAGVGLGRLVTMLAGLPIARRVPRRAATTAAAAVVVLVLAPAWVERFDYDRRGIALIEEQQAAEAGDGRDLGRLVAIAKQRGDGRVFAGRFKTPEGEAYRVGGVPVYAWLLDRDVDSFGFIFRTIAALSTDPEATFDEANPAEYEMYDIRYVLTPSDRRPGVPAKLVASSGRHRLWQVSTSGYLQVVDRSAAITADRGSVEQASREFRRSGLALRATYPGVAFAGREAPAPTFAGATPPAGSPGTVVRQSVQLERGVVTATVDARRAAVVLLKSSFDPRWRATVDGAPVKPVMMAPSLVGVDVPAGRHAVELRYDPVDDYPLLLGVGVVTLLGLALFPRRAAIRARLSASTVSRRGP